MATYKTVSLKIDKYAELEATAKYLTEHEADDVTVPALIYRLHHMYKQQLRQDKEQIDGTVTTGGRNEN
jgi:hypothetical protein